MDDGGLQFILGPYLWWTSPIEDYDCARVKLPGLLMRIMTKRKISTILIAVLFVVGSGYLAYAEIYASYIVRYKVTINIETPEGIRSGSAIREVSNSASKIKTIDFPQSGNPAFFIGEAVVIELGERGAVFAVLRVDPYQELYDAFPIKGSSTVEGIKYYRSLKPGTKTSLPERGYPNFVRFSNQSDPKSIELVLNVEQTASPPYERRITKNKFEEIFGEGVRIREILIEITDDPVTKGHVDKYLPKSFQKEIIEGWQGLSLENRNKIIDLIRFKEGF